MADSTDEMPPDHDRVVPLEEDVAFALPIYPMPKTRGDCAEVARPCVFVQCRYNLVLDVPPEAFERTSCALDVADEGENSLSDLAELFGLSRERVRQIEQRGLKKLGETKFGIQMRKVMGRLPHRPVAQVVEDDSEPDPDFDPDLLEDPDVVL